MGFMDPTERRFWAKVERPEQGCWEWLACKDPDGYGRFRFEGGAKAHRYSYELHKGPIPTGMQLDHLCRNRGCVNPDHLEAVTGPENTRRGGLTLRTRCPQGHELTDPNLVLAKKKQGARVCLACARARAAIQRHGGDLQKISDVKYRAIMGKPK